MKKLAARKLRIPADPVVRYLSVLIFSHFVIDFLGSALPALLPVLRAEFGLSYTLAGTLVTLSEATSVTLLLLAGILGDLRRQTWMIPVGLMLAATGLAALGFSSTFLLAIAAVMLMAAGRAVFHPEGARTAFVLAGRRQATVMSLWYLGGNSGYILGPLLSVLVATRLGLPALILFLPVALVAALLIWKTGTRAEAAPAGRIGQERRTEPPAANSWRSFSVLVLVILFRDVLFISLLTFYPFLITDRLGQDPALAALLIAAFIGFGTLANLGAGAAADRLGRKPVLLGCLLPVAPALALLPLAQGWLHLPLLALIGLGALGTTSVTLVMAQEFLPRNRALASAVAVGAGGAGGLLLPLLGAFADTQGLAAVFNLAAAMPILAMALAVCLPGRGSLVTRAG